MGGGGATVRTDQGAFHSGIDMSARETDDATELADYWNALMASEFLSAPTVSAARRPGPITYAQLLHEAPAPLDALKTVRLFAKRNMAARDSDVPFAIAAALYLATTRRAQCDHGVWLTTRSPAEFAAQASYVARACPWLDAQTRELLEADV